MLVFTLHSFSEDSNEKEKLPNPWGFLGNLGVGAEETTASLLSS